MELNCPSCARKHRTEDHPGAFEVNCVCGYSILVPDELAINAQTQESEASAASMSAAPLSMDAQDASLSIPLPQDDQNLTQTQLPTSINEQLTPPDQLPPEMPYDPYELSKISQNNNESDQNFEAINVPHSSADVQPESPFIESPQNSINEELSQAPYREEAPSNFGEIKAQTIVDRSLAASVGQLLGANYKIKIEKLDSARLKELSETCRQFISRRPWLEAELRKRKFETKQLETNAEFDNLPEVVALEIYLRSLQLGGNCHYERLS